MLPRLERLIMKIAKECQATKETTQTLINEHCNTDKETAVVAATATTQEQTNQLNNTVAATNAGQPEQRCAIKTTAATQPLITATTAHNTPLPHAKTIASAGESSHATTQPIT
jgi:hypothetical protein